VFGLLLTAKPSVELSSSPTAKANDRVTWQLCARMSSTCSMQKKKKEIVLFYKQAAAKLGW
jgi:hypothetical protein